MHGRLALCLKTEIQAYACGQFPTGSGAVSRYMCDITKQFVPPVN